MQRIVQKLPVVFVIVAYVVLGYSFFHFIYSYTISIPFADEWGVVDMVLDKIRLQYFFMAQTSEHRVGTGYIYLQFLSHLTHWNLLYETMSIGMLLFMSSFFACSNRDPLSSVLLLGCTICSIMQSLYKYVLVYKTTI